MVSIIIPVYNAARSLPACLDSVFAQTYAQLEVIAVDDGSRDGSLALLLQYSQNEPRLHVLAQKNGGAAAARNAGLAHATGDFLQFVDADDFLPPDATERMVAALTAETDLVIAHYWLHMGAKARQRGFLTENGTLSVGEYLMAMSKHPTRLYYSVVWNKLYRRALVTHRDIRFDHAFRWGEDSAFNMAYLREPVRGVAVLAQPVYHYIRTATSTSIKTALDLKTTFKTKRALYAQYRALLKERSLYGKIGLRRLQFLFSITLAD